MFESFREQYERFPESIIYQLENLLDFAVKLPLFDSVRLYDIWSAHNRRLAAGLSEKPTDLSWLREPTPPDFLNAFLKYLTCLFNYPVVDVRLLAFDELFRLIDERPELIAALLEDWPNLDHGQREYLATLLFSTGLRNPASAEQWASQLVELGKQEQHRNLQATIGEAVEIAAEKGANLNPTLLADARALKAPPRIVIAMHPLIHAMSARAVNCPQYLQWSLKLLAHGASPGELEAHTRRILSRLYLHPERGLEDEESVYRAYDINSNYDVIEISGEFDRAARAALNRSVQMLVESHAINHDALEQTEDLLRLCDPSDVLVKRIPRPFNIAWIDDELSDDEFTDFVDVEELEAESSTRDSNWVTVFEYTKQRTGKRSGTDPQQRATKAQVLVFGLPRGGRPPAVTEIQAEMRSGSLTRLRNRYRFELTRAILPSGVGRISPIVVVTSRKFRGRSAPAQAAIVPNIVQALGLHQNPDDLLGYINKGGDRVVRSIEWQEAFDQDRRRHEPRSFGYLLQIKRDMLKCLAKDRDVEFWAHLSASRTTDRYKPEYQMMWHEHSDVFPIRL
jgi:hypothetical protein